MTRVWAGKFVEVHVDGKWEYVRRARGIGAAVLLAIDDDGHVLLVEQYRVPLGRACIELPAGLVGDHDKGEEVLASAARELVEETGWEAAHLELIGDFASSPGMLGETFHLVRATGLRKVGDGGGVDGEDIVVHRVPLREVAEFLAAARARNCAIDAKLILLLGLLPG